MTYQERDLYRDKLECESRAKTLEIWKGLLLWSKMCIIALVTWMLWDLLTWSADQVLHGGLLAASLVPLMMLWGLYRICR